MTKKQIASNRKRKGKKPFQLWFPPKLLEKLHLAAVQENRSISNMIITIVSKYLEA